MPLVIWWIRPGMLAPRCACFGHFANLTRSHSFLGTKCESRIAYLTSVATPLSGIDASDYSTIVQKPSRYCSHL